MAASVKIELVQQDMPLIIEVNGVETSNLVKVGDTYVATVSSTSQVRIREVQTSNSLPK